MIRDDPGRTSVWHATADPPRFDPLTGDIDTDVVVVGAGITGLTAALMLAEAGRRVTVLEARRIAAGTTGGTTGKITSQHGTIYADLLDRHGDEAARSYGAANEAAITEIERLCRDHGVDADLVRTDAYVYALDEQERQQLREEFHAAEALELPAEWTTTTELPFPVAGALRFRNQAQIQPVRYCAGLAAAVDRSDGCAVHEDTRVTKLRESDGGVVAETARGTVRAEHAVVATLIPITDRGFEFARVRASREYGLAVSVDGDLPEGMYISAGSPTRSTRKYADGDRDYLVVVGESHEVGHDRDTDEHDRALEAFARQHFDVAEVTHRWSAQDFVPDDRLPFIGTTGFSDRIHVATGFQKWGLTNGTVAAWLLRDIIEGRDNPYREVFRPTRATVAASARQFLEHNLDVATRFAADRFTPDASSLDEIAPGTGATVRVGGKILAASRDEDGQLTVRSAVCAHLGCIVQWNQAEASWDCPCHGSRYDRDGTVLEGPTTGPLSDPT